MSVKKILLVDDEPVNIKILKAMLVPEGYEVFTAQNGLEALEKLNTDNPDIVLLDVMMPEMDGFEVCKRIKAQKDKRMIPVLMVTALQDKIHRQQAMEAGADDFLSKPIDRIELLIRVKSLIRIKTYSDELLESYEVLKEKNRELERLELAKEGLTHMIVHDLRGPLTNISMNIDMCLMQTESGSKINKYLSNASRQCIYLNEMIQGLLDIYRMEQGRLKPERQVTSPCDLLSEVIDFFRPQIEAKNVVLQVDASSNLPDILVDPRLIKRVISNILDNALRHTPNEGTIRVKAKGDPEKKCITISITDSGPGLDEKYHSRIFDKFEQVKLKKEGVTSGSIGLGLAFCKMATEIHGGHIWVSNRKGGTGCTFSFTLPAGPDSECTRTNHGDN